MVSQHDLPAALSDLAWRKALQQSGFSFFFDKWGGLSLWHENFSVFPLFFSLVMAVFNKQVVTVVPALSWSNYTVVFRGQLCYRYLFHLQWSNNSHNWKTGLSHWSSANCVQKQNWGFGVDLFVGGKWWVEEILVQPLICYICLGE